MHRLLALGITVHGQHGVGDYVMGTGHGDPWPPENVGRTIAGTGALTSMARTAISGDSSGQRSR